MSIYHSYVLPIWLLATVRISACGVNAKGKSITQQDVREQGTCVKKVQQFMQPIKQFILYRREVAINNKIIALYRLLIL